MSVFSKKRVLLFLNLKLYFRIETDSKTLELSFRNIIFGAQMKITNFVKYVITISFQSIKLYQEIIVYLFFVI
jgi:hypothetical protein